MNESERHIDAWALPLIFLWAVFFFAGMLPSVTLLALRSFGGVIGSGSRIYSPYVITIACSAYLSLFVHQRCLENGLRGSDAWVRALYVFTLGLLAFLDFPVMALYHLPEAVSPWDRYVIWAAIPFKLAAWAYLYIAILRYYALGHSRVFADMLSTRTRENARKTSALATAGQSVSSGSSEKTAHVAAGTMPESGSDPDTPRA